MSYDQAQTELRFTTPLGDNILMLTGASIEEEISGMFRMSLVCFSEEPDIAFEEIVGKSVTVAHEMMDGSDRFWNGIVRSFKQGRTSLERTYYSLDVVPWFWLLTQTSDCRVFQDMSVPAIIADVFDRNGWAGHYDASGIESYDPRLYCTQYRETAHDFVRRLMAEEGIHYFFKHEDGKHTLMLSDDSSENPACPGAASLAFNPEEANISPDTVSALESSQQMHTNKVTLQDFNYETLDDLAAEKAESGADLELEEYDYPGEYPEAGEGRRYATLRLEGHTAHKRVLSGHSGSCGLTAGYLIGITDHPRSDFNDTLVVTRVNHQISASYGAGGQGGEYKNQFSGIPSSVPYRPARMPSPCVRGVQTAMVVGPSGEEIYSDSLGRVKVHFHWDRAGATNHESSCWVRVSSLWADAQWGIFFLPRIGQEVIVDFEEGDPDRPLIVGRVYNGNAKPPYDPETNLTRSTIKTRSSPDGGAANFNEIRFEDKAGEEEFYIHAAKDKNVMVENDRGETVGNDETISIGNNRTETVGTNENITIGASRTESVGASETVSVAAARTHAVGANDALTVGAAQEITVGAARSINVGATQDTNVGVSESITVGEERTIDVGKNLKYTVGEDYTNETGKKVMIEAGEEITIKTGDASIVMKKNGDIEIEGKKIMVKASGDLILKGATIKEN